MARDDAEVALSRGDIRVVGEAVQLQNVASLQKRLLSFHPAPCAQIHPSLVQKIGPYVHTVRAIALVGEERGRRRLEYKRKMKKKRVENNHDQTSSKTDNA